MKKISILCLAFFYAFASQSQMTYFKAVLQGSQEVPPTTSAASGIAVVRYNTTTKNLDLAGNYQNLETAATISHIHSPAPVGSNAPFIITLTNTAGTSGTITGAGTLTAAQETDLFDTLMYVNVHTVANPGGEIRGQLSPTTDPNQTNLLGGTLSGAQEATPTGSAASGNVAVLLDNVTNEIFLAGDFQGLSANATLAHIHGGQPGVSGPVVVTLSVTAGTAGTVTGNAIVSPTFADSMVAGLTYVNIHNANFPGGEIRAQLGNIVLPVTLKYFNGYKQNNKVALIWESAQEQNLKQYEIEQQAQEPAKWINKAIITTKGGNTASKYSFLDDPIVNNSNHVIYRLKMVDIDGKFSYSPVIKINFLKSKPELSITTNPVANGQLRYTITGLLTNTKADVYIVDYSGRVVVKTTTSTLINNDINIANLPAGRYKLLVRVDENIFRQSFIK